MIKIKPFRSIKRKLTMNLVIAFAAIIVIVLILVTVVGQYSYDRIMYNQLKEVARMKNTINRHKGPETYSDEDMEFIQSGLWVAHFLVNETDDGVKLQIDAFTERLFAMRDGEVIYKMAELSASADEELGKLRDNEMIYHYYFDRSMPGGSTMVYYIGHESGGSGKLILMMVFLLMLAIIPVAVKFAGGIVKPILELEDFAEEIAKKNWNVTTPETENDEIGILAKALDRMKEALKSAEERDRRFLQAASHDLKTPIMIIKGYAQAQIDGVDIESETDAPSVIKEEVSKLERRVNQLMHINALGHTLEHEERRMPIRIDKMLKSLTESFKVIRPDVNWHAELEETEVLGDSDALLIALENIFENQIRFANKKVHITLNRQDMFGIIRVSNDGPKFEIDDPMTLFDPYRKDLEGQFGLGLSIVRQVIEGHGGSVLARSTDEGVEFIIKLPILDQ